MATVMWLPYSSFGHARAQNLRRYAWPEQAVRRLLGGRLWRA